VKRTSKLTPLQKQTLEAMVKAREEMLACRDRHEVLLDEANKAAERKEDASRALKRASEQFQLAQEAVAQHLSQGS
jgi:hypothetical protein